MQKYENAIINGATMRPAAGASVLVKNADGTNATLYSSNTLTALANPVTTDANGDFSFYAANGRYSLQISGSGIAALTVSDILLYDPADAADTSGVWTPIDLSGAGLTLTTSASRWLKTGNLIFLSALVSYPVTANSAAAVIGGIPLVGAEGIFCGLSVAYSNVGFVPTLMAGGAGIALYHPSTGVALTNAQMSGKSMIFSGDYFV